MLQSVKPLTRKQQVGTTLHDCRVEKKEKQVGSPYPFLRSLSLQCFWWLVFFFHFAFTCILPSVTMIWFPDKKKDGVAPWDSYCLGTKVLSNLKGLDDHMRCYWVHGVGCLVVNHLPWWWSCRHVMIMMTHGLYWIIRHCSWTLHVLIDYPPSQLQGFPGDAVVKEYACQCKRHGFNPWVRKILWSRKLQPTPVSLTGKFHEQRSLVGYSPWGHKESDTTEQVNTWKNPFYTRKN